MRLSLLLGLFLVSSFAFYIPGVAPRDYQPGEPVELKVVSLDSVKTQLPYEFYSLPFCKPEQVEQSAENLGEILAGDRIENSAYEIEMNQPEFCKFLCARTYSKKDLDHFAQKVEEGYRVNWIVDNLPASTKYFTEHQESDGSRNYVIHYEKGFPLGVVGSADELLKTVPGIAYVNNHVRLLLKYHGEKKGNEVFRIVGFEVEPFSIKHQLDDANWNYQEYLANPEANEPYFKNCRREDVGIDKLIEEEPQPVSGPSAIDGNVMFWTYDVVWEPSDIKWASRWDLYLKLTDSQIHWFSIINSITVVLFLSGMLAMIMTRTLHRDLARYNQIDPSDDARQEETGWKLIHGDVFRRPEHGGPFSVLFGTGVQVFAMTLVTLTFALLGFLSPANRGGLLTALLLLYVFMGFLSGYYSTRWYKMFKLTDWKRNTLWTAIAFPGVVFCAFFILNLFIWGEKSSGAVPFGTLVALVVLWCGISVPLCYLGSWFAFKKPAFEPPVKVNEIPRQSIVEKTCYTNPTLAVLIGGILPFGAVFIEIFFIMSSVWLHQFYYVFGFLYIVFLILIVTCAEISIVMCYFQLCNEDYHWWWRSYLTSGSSALYLFLYSIIYFFTRLEITMPVTTLLFFGYMLLISLFFFVLTGTIGHVACFHFVRKIYASIKIE